MRPRDIGTRAETAVVRYLVANGFPHAERRALKGNLDQGDVTGCVGLCIEVKGGDAARNASDGQIARWLAETETERVNARADIGILVVQRLRQPVGRWWVVLAMGGLMYLVQARVNYDAALPPVRLHLIDAVTLLRAAGYGRPLEAVA